MKNIEWEEYNLENLFGKSTRGKRLKSADRLPGKLPFVTAGETNEGVSAFIGNDVTIFSEGTVTIDMFGSAKYRDYDYGADDHIAVVHTENYSKNVAKFITSAIHKSTYTGKFSYARNFYAKDADETIIELPTKNGRPDFVFMERFISLLEADRIQELKTYLISTGLKDTTLTEKEQKAFDLFTHSGEGLTSNLKWADFKIGDLFEIHSYKKRFDANKVTVLDSGHPYVVRTALNNGVKGFLHEDIQYLNDGNTISFGQDTATMFYQEKPYFTGDKIKILKSKFEEFNKFNSMFFISTMSKAFSSFSWGSSSFSIRIIENQKISLPVDTQGLPDLELMDTLIKAIQKVVIKGVINYVDTKIEVHKHVL